jgi:hypothetical protein
MNIGSVSGSIPTQSLQRIPESSEVKGAPDNNGDAEDTSKVVKAAPTVNSSGQSVGNIINEVA